MRGKSTRQIRRELYPRLTILPERKWRSRHRMKPKRLACGLSSCLRMWNNLTAAIRTPISWPMSPMGASKKGEAIVAGKVPAKAPACATCHGATLRGIDAIPPIAGRSPTYVVRQLYELQAGIRNGQAAPPMKAAVEKLRHDDMIGVAANLATLPPCRLLPKIDFGLALCTISYRA